MRARLFFGAYLASFSFAIGIAAAQTHGKTITAADAKDHIGQTETVCGRVASARYAETSKGEPTFLNLDAAYPHEIFTVVIWGSDRAKFGQPEEKYANARVCVTGAIQSYRGTPEIIANRPSQIVSDAAPSK